MSGHNKWSKIKYVKAKEDAKKGKVFARFAHEIMLAAKSGGHVAARSGVVADPLRGLRRVCRYDVTDVVYYSQVRGL